MSSLAVRIACFLVAGGGVVVAVLGLLRLSLALMVLGTGGWLLGVIAWEAVTGRFH